MAKIEPVDAQRLAYLENGGSYLFALVDESVREGEEYGFSLRYDKLRLTAGGKELLQPVLDEVSFLGRFRKTEQKENGERVLRFYYCIGDYVLEAASEHGYKINAIDGDACYKNSYRYAVNRASIRLVPEDEPGLDGRVLEILDYGCARFARAEADGQQFQLRVEPDFSAERLRLAFDGNAVSVYSTAIDMKIC